MDSIFIFGLMLVLFGPKKLPEIARQAGKLMMEFRRASNDFRMQMEDELRAAEQSDRQKKIDAEAQAALALTAATTATTTSLPSGAIVQLAADGTTELLPSKQDDTPAPAEAAPAEATFVEQQAPLTILPPSVGETVSTNPPNRYRVSDDRPDFSSPEAVPDLAPVATQPAAAPATAEEFYAQRDAEIYPTGPAIGVSSTEPSSPESAEALAARIKAAVTGKLPGTEMYPDTAPMAESEQAPIHHG